MINDSKTNYRQESEEDHDIVFDIIERAFREVPISDKTEHHLVNRLRASDAFIPELSIVAEIEEQVVAHILLTELRITNDNKTTKSLALAPVSVLPDFQNRGIGGELIKYAHDQATELGYGSIILIGHANYYPRFGYQLLSNFEITLPFPAPDENCMVIELQKDALDGVKGEAVYAKEFVE